MLNEIKTLLARGRNKDAVEMMEERSFSPEELDEICLFAIACQCHGAINICFQNEQVKGKVIPQIREFVKKTELYPEPCAE